MVPASKVFETGVLEKVSCVLCKVDENKVETVVDLSVDEVEIEVEVYGKVDEAGVDGNVSL